MCRCELIMKTELVLCIDIGNTRLKWGVCELTDVSFLRTGIVENIKNILPNELGLFFSELEPMPVWVSSVASHELVSCLSVWVKENWGLELNNVKTELNHYKALNGYQKSSGLGVDRWLAMVAAQFRLNNNYCIIDAGTAITIDVVDGNGNHIGGVIMPGKQLMLSALFSGADQIDEENGEFVMLADNTSDAVYSGVLSCLVGGVDRVLSGVIKQNKNIRFVITGGDAALLSQYSSYDMSIEVNLVLEGVGLVARNAYA